MTALMVSVPDAAKAMGISESTLWRLIREREITTVEIKLRRRVLRRIEQTEINRFIAAHRQPATTSPA